MLLALKRSLFKIRNEIKVKGINPIHNGNKKLVSFPEAIIIKIGINKIRKIGNTNPSIKEKSRDIEFNLRPKICNVLNLSNDCLVKKLNIKILGIFMFIVFRLVLRFVLVVANVGI